MYSLRNLARAGTQATRVAASRSAASTSSLRSPAFASASSVRSFSRSACALDGTTQDPSQLKPKNEPSTTDTEEQSELLNANYGQAEIHKEKEPARNEAVDDKAKGKGKTETTGKENVEDLSISNKNK